MGTLYIKKIVKFLKKLLMLSKLQLQNFHENSPCFKSPFTCLKHSRTSGPVVFLFNVKTFYVRNLHHYKFMCSQKKMYMF